MVGTNRTIAIATCAVITLAGTLGVRAQGPTRGHADLNGYEETPTISSPASGTLDVQINGNGTSLDYTLTYSGLPTNVRFAHIHIGRTAIMGGIMVFLCTNEGPPPGVPAPPACPLTGGTVRGTLSMADVLAVTAQGVAAGDFAAFLAALRSEAAYGNVHTTQFGAGEIRGQITFTGNSANSNGGDSNNGNNNR